MFVRAGAPDFMHVMKFNVDLTLRGSRRDGAYECATGTQEGSGKKGAKRGESPGGKKGGPIYVLFTPYAGEPPRDQKSPSLLMIPLKYLRGVTLIPPV